MVPSGIDEDKLGTQLAHFDRALQALEETRQSDLARLTADAMVRAATERRIQIAIECCLNIGNHVLAGLSLRPADSYRGVFLRLGEEGIVPDDLAEEMAASAQFRNRLIHLYWEVSPGEVAEFCSERLGVLRQFAAAVCSWLKGRGYLPSCEA